MYLSCEHDVRGHDAWYTASSNSYLSTQVAKDNQNHISLWCSIDSIHTSLKSTYIRGTAIPLQEEALKEMLRNYPEVVQDKPCRLYRLGCTSN